VHGPPLDRERQVFNYDWSSPSLSWHLWPWAVAMLVVFILAIVYWATRKPQPPSHEDKHDWTDVY
jgi:hypothetical protein